MTQRTDQWFRDRLGKVTASRFGAVMGSPAAWRSYAQEIREGIALRARIDAGEDVEVGPDFDVPATAWGREWEDVMRAEYEMARDVDVVVPHFMDAKHITFALVGASPDGLIEKATGHEGIGFLFENIGGIEGKCPFNQNVHARTLVTREMPAEHKPQVQGVIWVCELLWCDFLSFDPRRDDDGRLFVARQLRDETYIALLAERVGRFWQFVLSGESDPGDFYAVQGRDIPQLF